MTDVDVVVVGAGPTGLTLACLLGRLGIRTLIVERNATTVQEPRAVSIDDEALRTMQSVGVIDRVLKHILPGYGSEYLTPERRPFLTVAPTQTPYGYPRRNAFRQPVLEAQLRDHLQRFPSLERLFGWRVEAVSQEGEVVHAVVADDEGRTRGVSCKFLVGADGAKSFVRDVVGTELEGKTFGEQWLIVDLENSPAPSRETQVFCDSRRPCIALPGPGLTRRFEFKLLPGESPDTMTDPAVVDPLLKMHGAAAESVIRRKVVYTFHARIAPRWSSGRIFLAGDACHLTPPFAGQGMNSGIRDAHNLAWKLAAVVSGQLGERLLDSYQQERQHHVGAMIDLALHMGRIMAPKTRLRGMLTQQAFRLVNVWPHARDYFAEMRYKPKASFSTGFLLKNPRLSIESLVGQLIPQPRVVIETGEEMLLDHVLGDGFALLAFTGDTRCFARATAQPIFSRLGVSRVAIGSPPKASSAHGVAVVWEPGQYLSHLGGRGDPLVLLVRPDRYILGAFTVSTADTFVKRLEALVARTWGGPQSELGEVA